MSSKFTVGMSGPR